MALKPLSTIDKVFAGVVRGESRLRRRAGGERQGGLGRAHARPARRIRNSRSSPRYTRPLSSALSATGRWKTSGASPQRTSRFEQCRGWLANQPSRRGTRARGKHRRRRAPRGGRSGGGRRRLVRGRRDGARPRILAQAIQDRRDNVTRFLVIAREANPPCADCEDKTSVVLSLRHKPGALQHALEPFARRGINLTRVESRPGARPRVGIPFLHRLHGPLERAGGARDLRRTGARVRACQVARQLPESRAVNLKTSSDFRTRNRRIRSLR